MNSESLRRRNINKVKLKSREDFLNVFTPASPILSPVKFVGRQQPLEEMISALLSKGADLIVFGERGCGKSSLAYMLHDFARGDFEILEYYGLKERLEEKGFLAWLVGPDRKEFNVIWVDGYGKSLDELINAILTRRKEFFGGKEKGPGLLSYIPREADQIEIAAKIGFDKLITAEGEYKETHIPKKPINIKEGFEMAMQRYSNHNKKQLIIIIDEFDTVSDRSEISHYLKNSMDTRFVMVGIAEFAFDLIGEHSSIARQTHAVKLEPMRKDELRDIVEIGSAILQRYMVFDSGVVDEIVAKSYRSPFWCHFFAKALVQEQMELSGNFDDFLKISHTVRGGISTTNFDRCLHNLHQNPESRLFEEQLQAVTLDDEINKKVLLSIAKHEKGIISSAAIVKSLETEDGLTKDDVLATIEGFLGMRTSPFELKSKIRDIISFSFVDPNFKRYILIRNADLG